MKLKVFFHFRFLFQFDKDNGWNLYRHIKRYRITNIYYSVIITIIPLHNLRIENFICSVFFSSFVVAKVDSVYKIDGMICRYYEYILKFNFSRKIGFSLKIQSLPRKTSISPHIEPPNLMYCLHLVYKVFDYQGLSFFCCFQIIFPFFIFHFATLNFFT